MAHVHPGPCPHPWNLDPNRGMPLTIEANDPEKRAAYFRASFRRHVIRRTILIATAFLVGTSCVIAGVLILPGSILVMTVVGITMFLMVGFAIWHLLGFTWEASTHFVMATSSEPTPSAIEHRCVRSLITGGRECECERR